MTRSARLRQRACGAILGAGWRGLAMLLAPALRLNLRLRVRRGKEIAACLPQRRGFAQCPRPSGPLVWLHAASVGETVAVVPVIAQVLLTRPSQHVLITTGTISGAEILHARLRDLPGHERVHHQFAPLDVPRWVARFVDFWRPDVAALVESELWPNLIAACVARRIPVALLSGRMSDRSLAGWRRAACLLHRMLSSLAWVMARSTEDARRLLQGGANRIDLIADLKDATGPLPYDAAALDELRRTLAGRPVWIAASTHPGEEAEILHTADLIRQAMPDVLTIIIPRHPQRGAEVAALSDNPIPRRSLGQAPTPRDTVWICDTLGETGLFYALAAPVLLGNSLPGCAGGGHNPVEPARAGCALASGPKTDNFRQAYARLGDSVRHVTTAQDIAAWVLSLLRQEDAPEAAGAAARRHVLPDPDIARQVAQALIALGRT